MDAPPENWDFYLTLVDDAPATIRVDLAWMTRPLPADCTHLHVAFLPLDEPGEHGMGGEADRARLQPVEDAVFDRTRRAGAVPVGRLRNRGRWQLCAYGPEDLDWEAWFAELGPPGTEVATQADVHGAYLLGFLLPSPERQLWMLSRRACDQLIAAGDLTHLPRLVHHRIGFPGPAPREFGAEVRGLGFELEVVGDGVRLSRFDSVELDEIHPIVVDLVQRADRHGGEYLGWECDLETD